MEYTRLGTSGLIVSRLALGCMTFGDTSSGFSKWALGEEESEPIFRQAVELGITFWDTANAYSFGSSEEIVGRAIKKYSRREDIVLATKVFYPMHAGPGGSGTSRKAIMEQIDASLTRLGTDYVDLYQIHRLDYETPAEETMEALHDVVKAGKARYIGASSMLAWEFSKLQYTADLHGWTRFVSMQDQYNLLMREEEREMFGLLADQGVGSVPWSPLGRGRLTRPWGEETHRSESDPAYGRLFTEEDSNRKIVNAVQSVAQARGVSMATIALAWVLANPVVSAPIVGASKPQQLVDAAVALDITLGDEEIAALEEHYTPRLATGMSAADRPPAR
ncbi:MULTISPECIES: aldo/keto reductase [Streptomyces]|uniref:aldo/keto reductase n=1 Tax=Streptomyces TaxID=1883 RepID=UPI00287FD79B|nr:aldo/keto reductase [Streptomyces sp. CGMCC 4.1456]WNF67634.1 aldo/keto reductase [Streptomyces sp. CGMCC 4.1456]